MTNQERSHHAVYAGVPTGQNPYGLQPKSNSLSPRQKRGAAWAGIVGFNLLSLGWTLFVVPLAFALFGAVVAIVLAEVRRSANGIGQGFQQFVDFFESMNLGLLLVTGVLMVVIGLILMVLAILLSRIILRAHAVQRPTAVTWAGAGVAIVGSWFVTWLPGLIAQLVGGTMMSANAGTVGTAIAASGLYIVLTIAAISVVGWLAWWWMAHVFRGSAVPETTARSMTPGQE